jgi:hypothetical protein
MLPGFEFVLTDVGQRQPEFEIDASQQRPDHLVIQGSPRLSKLVIRERMPKLTIELGDDQQLLLIGGGADELHIFGGRIETRCEPPHKLRIDGSAIQARSWRVPNVILSGLAVTTELSAERCELDPSAKLVLGSDISIDRAEPLGDPESPLRLSVNGSNTLSLGSLPPGSELELNDCTLHLRCADIDSHSVTLRRTTFTGAGNLVVLGALDGPSFNASNPLSLNVNLLDGASITDGTGFIVLQAGDRTLCAGAPGGALRLEAVLSANGAELQGVDIYDLALGDLAQLKDAERLVPWVPERARAREREDTMQVGGGSPATLAGRRAHFWTRLSVLLKEKHAPGSVQSQVRYAAARARRRALPWGRERAILTLFAAVGYGESIGLPILCHALVSLVAAPFVLHDRTLNIHSADAWENLLEAWGRLLQAPLTFFRFTSLPRVTGFGSNLAVVVPSALGVLLLFFALAAVRRIAKPD